MLARIRLGQHPALEGCNSLAELARAQILWPLITPSSPTTSLRVWSEARSLLAPDSLYPGTGRARPVIVSRIHFCFCHSSPRSRRAGRSLSTDRCRAPHFESVRTLRQRSDPRRTLTRPLGRDSAIRLAKVPRPLPRQRHAKIRSLRAAKFLIEQANHKHGRLGLGLARFHESEGQHSAQDQQGALKQKYDLEARHIDQQPEQR
jgi:hypothetical protein